MGHVWGDGARAHRRREQLRDGHATASIRDGDSEIRADGLFSLGYPRDDGGEEINARVRVDAPRSSTAAARVRARRLAGVGPAVGRVPPDRRVPAPVRLRRHDDRRRRRLRRAVREGDARRCASRARGVRLDGIDIAKGDRRDHRRGVRRLGRHLLVQRRRPAHSGRDARARWRIPQAQPSGPPRVHGRRQRHVRRRRATTCGSASTTCSSATKAVGQVTGTLALRGDELSGELEVASPRLASPAPAASR